jgi:hypothetical protein
LRSIRAPLCEDEQVSFRTLTPTFVQHKCFENVKLFNKKVMSLKYALNSVVDTSNNTITNKNKTALGTLPNSLVKRATCQHCEASAHCYHISAKFGSMRHNRKGPAVSQWTISVQVCSMCSSASVVFLALKQCPCVPGAPEVLFVFT